MAYSSTKHENPKHEGNLKHEMGKIKFLSRCQRSQRLPLQVPTLPVAACG